MRYKERVKYRISVSEAKRKKKDCEGEKEDQWVFGRVLSGQQQEISAVTQNSAHYKKNFYALRWLTIPSVFLAFLFFLNSLCLLFCAFKALKKKKYCIKASEFMVVLLFRVMFVSEVFKRIFLTIRSTQMGCEGQLREPISRSTCTVRSIFSLSICTVRNISLFPETLGWSP